MHTLSRSRLRGWIAPSLWALLILTSAPPAAAAAADDWDAFVRAGGRWIQDEGLGLVSESPTLPQVEAGVAYSWTGPLALELAGSASGSSAQLFDEMAEGGLSLLGLRASARYGLPINGWLRSTLRGGFALDWATVSLSEEGSATVRQTRLVPGLQGLAGVEAILRADPKRGDEGLRFVFSLEGGYLATLGSTDFDRLRPGEEGSASERIRPGSVRLGSLDFSGWLFHLGAAFRF